MAIHFNLADMIEAVADTVPEREALVCGDRRATYAQLEARATRLAHFLQSRGVQAGNNVGLYMYNCVEYLEAMLACFKLRAVPINVNYRYVDDELRYIFDNADLVACVHNRQFIPHLEAIADAVPNLKACIAVEDGSVEDAGSLSVIEFEKALEGQSERRDFEERSEDDHFILYTGGTTGMPKGVIWSHKALLFAAMGGGGHFSPLGPCQTGDDIVSRIAEHPVTGIALAPLMHGASWWYACIQLLAGNKMVLNHHRSLDGEQVWDICEREKINAFQIVGDAMAIPLLDALESNPGRWDLSSIFGMSSGGAVFSKVKQEGFRKHFPNIRIINSFGSSESGQMGADSGGEKSEGGLGNVSRSPFMDVIVQEESGTHRMAKPGERGIFARSGHIPEGYYNEPEKTAKTFIVVEGKRWLLTGDEAIIEANDTITVFGRGSNCINSGGEKIFPEEVEDALKAHSGVFDALVVGVPDERWGSRVVAVLRMRNGYSLGLEAIQTHCRKHIAGYKIPRGLVLVDEVPRSPSGKPDYQTAARIAREQSQALSA